jgi:hypothetical protein
MRINLDDKQSIEDELSENKQGSDVCHNSEFGVLTSNDYDKRNPSLMTISESNHLKRGENAELNRGCRDRTARTILRSWNRDNIYRMPGKQTRIRNLNRTIINGNCYDSKSNGS